jgi:hypothetical protein
MVRPMSYLLAFWLAALFVAGQNTHVPKWLVWLNGLAALFALLGASIAPLVSRPWRVGGPIALSLGLLGLWLGGILTHVNPWLPWCTFMGAIWYLGVAVADQLWSPQALDRMRET